MKKTIPLMVAVTVLGTVSCGGGGAKGSKFKGSMWIEDYGVGGTYHIMLGLEEPKMYINLLMFHPDQNKLAFEDGYNEYGFVDLEFDTDKENNFNIYLRPRSDVLAIKKKEPSQWVTMQRQLVFPGKYENDPLIFPSRRRDKEGNERSAESTVTNW
jgi:hypothetical protein